MRKYLIIISYDMNEIVKEFDITDNSTPYVDRLEDGLNINLNHDKFYTKRVNKENNNV